MNIQSRETKRYRMQAASSVVGGIALNVLLFSLVSRLELPLYIDTAGTIGVAAVSGLFPGIVTGLATNVICSLFHPDSIYYGILSVLIAIDTYWFAKNGYLKRGAGIAGLILASALIGGGLGAFLQWLLLGGTQFAAVRQASVTISDLLGMPTPCAFTIVNLGLNVVDKAICVFAALAVLHLLPEERKRKIWNSGWRQAPLPAQEVSRFKAGKGMGERSLETRVTLMLTMTAILLTGIMVLVSVRLFFTHEREQYTQTARSAAKFAAECVDPDRVDAYLSMGETAEGYAETEKMLYSIRENSLGVEYLYVLQIREDGCYFLFDLDTEDTPANEPGTRIAFEEAFLPYLPALFAGEEIEPIESNDISGWVLTAYCPVRNAAGRTVCYAGADVSMLYLSGYVKDFLLRVLFIFSGFFATVLAYGLWISRVYLVYPINSMAACADGFMDGAADQQALDGKVKKLRALRISTGDEVEKLYRAICKMTLNTADQMRNIRHFAEVNEKMQNGLIITMADMVENRDSDTGAHIQKTAAYVKIILNGLKAKGYYAEKLTERYISDVVTSAPLHDVGKISIPDVVLNKPGKLTEAEYEIMKRHTTAGKEIMERAISTVEGENYLKEARNMAAYHHERWDGKGYPEGLHGEVIPLSARVMAVADVFDALTSTRVYKPPLPLENAVAMIREGAGAQFDPKCVEVFVDSLPEIMSVYKKYMGA